MVRPALPLLALLAVLAGCGPVLPIWAGAEAASVTVFGRGVVDMGVSAVTGRDCSMVRLDRGQTYCAGRQLAQTVPFCTRSLGVADCWASPALLPGAPVPLDDTPGPSRDQLRYRNAGWPRSLATLAP